ncbi:uncharacterized protein N7458_005562 [Penicillium daleae]|uniref:Uncharacterized protein n=1 Tax=Penicillium daleae TaxID=63821 RepID=A0AAD6C898_9EURO|nr:uncharacterized protein N7458_005562 [Penicillium daleae]KAJ5454606.1 hypothetical protein N7458_005562 [Penicillium daleae]
MSVSAKGQAEAQGQEDVRDTDKDVDMGASKPWSGVQPRYMNITQEKRSEYDLDDVGRPEALKGNRLIRERPEGANEYSQEPVEGRIRPSEV